MSPPTFVLASSSPRRRLLLEQLGLAFDIIAPAIDEAQLPNEGPATMVERVARLKTLATESRLPVLAADTSVVLDGQVLGKPHEATVAEEMLRSLSDSTHTVATGVAVRLGEAIRSCVVTADVTFAPMSDAEISWYVGTGEPLDKAGAYGLNGCGTAFVRSIAGSHSTVIGLPLSETIELLRWADVTVAGA